LILTPLFLAAALQKYQHPSHSLDAKAHLQLLPESVIPQVSSQFSNVFLFSASISLREKLEGTQNWQSQLPDKNRSILRLTKFSSSSRGAG